MEQQTEEYTKYEIEVRAGKWVEVTYDIFRSWTGGRRIDGEPFDGKVYMLWSSKEVK